ncbi:45998_t:CDS:2 [Gigaspora margarita]|uniref:45998_t:CDS:1 n=1 Tax=Gigaspora margarita TaxID=4874 RepID=A0ABN7UQU9_GIGMA|nr:45998_t:CDS:2 [Gigaspora margarita]
MIEIDPQKRKEVVEKVIEETVIEEIEEDSISRENAFEKELRVNYLYEFFGMGFTIGERYESY